MIALLALIISLVINHTQYKYQNLIYFFRPTLCIFVVTTYFVSRYDVLNSIHSFALASKSQHYLEMKLLFLYSFVYFNVNRFVKKHRATLNLKFSFTIGLIFYFYFLYIISSILYDVLTNALSSLNVTPGGDKFLYLSFFLLFCIKFLFNKITNPFFWCLLMLSLLSLCTQSLMSVLFVITLIVYYKYSLLKVSQNKPTNYKLFLVHTLLLLLAYLLILYSDVEIFFTKITINEYFSKNFVISTNQYSFFKNFYQQDFCLTRTSGEVFFQKTADLVKLLTQNINTNYYYNVNKINLTKVVLFLQNYLYLYIVIIVTSMII